MTSLSKFMLHTIPLSFGILAALAVPETIDSEQISLLTGQLQLQSVSKAGVHIIVLLLYAAVSIPLIFYFYRKKQGKMHLRLFLIGNTLFFTAVIILLSLPTRHDKPFLSCIWLDAYMDTRQTSLAFNTVRSPEQDSFSLEAESDWDITLCKPDAQVTMTQTASGISLSFANLPAFKSVSFLTEQTKPCSDLPVTAELSYFHNRLFGTITNHSDYDLEDTIFLYAHWLVPIRTLKSGETIWISQYEMYSTQDTPYEEQIYHMLQSKKVYQQKNIQLKQQTRTYMMLLDTLQAVSVNQGILLGHTLQTPNILTEQQDSWDTCCLHFTGVHLNINSPGNASMIQNTKGNQTCWKSETYANPIKNGLF